MKTLDETIKGFECCEEINCAECPYANWDKKEWRCDPSDKDDDALHYLKTYRENRNAYEEGCRKAEEARERYLEAVRNCEVAENKYHKLYEEASQNFAVTSQNDPDGDHQQLLKCQALLQDFYRNDPISWDELKTMEGKPVWLEDSNGKGEWVLLSGTEDEYLYFVYRDCVEYKIYRDEQGKRWQAYRKERN